jgi:hypothetical protein
MKQNRRSILGLVALLLAVSAASQWWAGRSQAQLGQKMSALARPGDIQLL